jgi:hypothetical protein
VITVQIGPSPQQVYRLLTRSKRRVELPVKEHTPVKRDPKGTRYCTLRNGNAYKIYKDLDTNQWYQSWAKDTDWWEIDVDEAHWLWSHSEESGYNPFRRYA